MSGGSTILWRFVLGAIVVFMLAPLLILVLFSFSEGSLLKFPITGLTVDWFVKVFDRSQFWAALDNSLVVTGTVGAVSTIVGTIAALGLARARARVAGLTMSLFTLPVMVPPLVMISPGIMSHHRIGSWTVTSLVPSGKVASTCTSWIISGIPSITWSREITSAPAAIKSATERPSRAPSTT